MIYISHRGNINGKVSELENSPEYIKDALDKEYNVEVDIWFINNKWYFGHDEPIYEININNYRLIYCHRIWFHCKNLDAILELSKFDIFIYFWHQNDFFTLTSNKYIWTYPGNKLTEKSICVLPELFDYSDLELKSCTGICSDYIENYKI